MARREFTRRYVTFIGMGGSELFTYQMQNRGWYVKEDKPIGYPANVNIEIIIEPGEPYGVGNNLFRSVEPGQKVKISWDSNSGRFGCYPDDPLRVIEDFYETNDMIFKIKGNCINIIKVCSNDDEVISLAWNLYYLIPPLLNVNIVDPPIIKNLTANIGGAIVSFGLMKSIGQLDVQTGEGRKNFVRNSFKRFKNLINFTNRRLVAALHYFHVSCRLRATGESPWEFMAESILNLSKLLEVLFGGSRDNVRSELVKLGYTEKEIEGIFIPIMVLRNEFDVGHVSLSLMDVSKLRKLYKFIETCEKSFRELFNSLFYRLENGSYALPMISEEFDQKKEKIIDRILNNIILE